MERLLGVAPTRSIPQVMQAEGLPHVDEIGETLDNLDEEVDGDECDGDEDETADYPRCSIAPRRQDNSKNTHMEGFEVADMEADVFVQDSDVYKASSALAESLEQLGAHENNT